MLFLADWLTRFFYNDIVFSTKKEIEVACSNSKIPDAAVAGEGIPKEKMPKEHSCCDYILGDMIKSHITVIERWGAIHG